MKRTKASDLFAIMETTGRRKTSRVERRAYRKIIRKARRAARQGYGGIYLSNHSMPTINSSGSLNDVFSMLREDGFTVMPNGSREFVVRWRKD